MVFTNAAIFTLDLPPPDRLGCSPDRDPAGRSRGGPGGARPGLAAVVEPHGEEAPLAQARALSSGWQLHRRLPETRPEVVPELAQVNPYGINTFLQQEVEPEKRERQVQMIADAAFTGSGRISWADIEIHGRGDFIDRRNDPDGVDAWPSTITSWRWRAVRAGNPGAVEQPARLEPRDGHEAVLRPAGRFRRLREFAAAVADATGTAAHLPGVERAEHLP